MMRYLAIILIIGAVSSCGGKPETDARKGATPETEYLEKGEEIAKATQAELLAVVSEAMASGGPVHAIEYCNLQALGLKDSLSLLYDCQIRRISNRYRNPEDRPKTRTETEQLREYQLAHQKGETLQPEVHIFEDRVEYYQPIIIQTGACLVCHGDPESQIAGSTLERIRELYPGDLATGFAMNDFRGAWKITFDQ